MDAPIRVFSRIHANRPVHSNSGQNLIRKNMKTIIKSLITVALCFPFLYSCRVIPKGPSAANKEIPLIPQPKSEIDIPVTADLSSYVSKAEDAVPPQMSGHEEPCQGVRYSYLFKRSRLEIQGAGKSLSLCVRGDYSIDVTYCAVCFAGHCVVPKIGGSCGVNEPLRQIDISYSSSIDLLKNYRLKSTTTLVKLQPINRCTVTVLGIDATDRVIKFVKKRLEDLGKSVDKRIDDLDFKPIVQTAWNKVSTEIKLGNLGYMAINPKALRLSALNFDGSTLRMSVGLTANPTITTESAQLPITEVPDLSDFTPGNGFNIYLDLSAGYDTLSKYLDRKVAGTVIKIGHKRFVINKANVYGIGNQKIVVAVDFKGRRRGQIFLTGTPSYNSITHELTVPDLDFDINTKEVLLRMAKWIFSNKINSALREKAKFDFSSVIASAKQKLHEELNQDLADNIKISGDLNDLNIQDIYPENSRLLLRSLANGRVSLTITTPDSTPIE